MKTNAQKASNVHPGGGHASLESILITEELARRPSRPPDYETENRALVVLAQALADSPQTILQTMADTILDVLRSDSAGVSLLAEDEKEFYWPAIAGKWKPHIGGGTPRNFGPCGDVLDRDCALMMKHIERRYDYFRPVTPLCEECLLVPFHIEGKAVGTIWAVIHEGSLTGRKFDTEDLRQIESLGRFASVAHRVIGSLSAARGQRRAALNLMEDAIHARQQMEKLNASLRRHASQFETLLNDAPLGLYVVDGDFRIRHVNPSTFQFFGAISDVIGRDFDEVIHILWPKDYADEIVRLFRRTLETGEPYATPERTEERLDRGVIETYEWQINRIPLPEGGYGVVCYFREISEWTRLTGELRQNAADMSEADRRKDEFLAMLAHELRNPLAPLRNAAQVLRLSEGNGEAVRMASEMIERQVGQMVRLVDDLLDVSRVSRGKIDLRRCQFELAPVVHDAVESTRSLYESMDHELTVSLPAQPIFLNADPARLTQVLGNLLNNACKFTDKGGRIALTAKREGGQAVIRVRDSGVGIAPDQLHRIFDMFTQIDTSLERSVSGLGIGLTLVKTLVEMHDGSVEVASAGLGHGCEFVVRLPVLAETAGLPPAPTPNKSEPTRGRRILVVDDNRDSAESLAELLKLTGHETYTAHDGLEAVEAAETHQPDVVLLDIGLPRMNGYEAARTIRDKPWGKCMVLVALTGWGQDDDRRKSKEAGFDGHLVKPVDHAALTKLLAEAPPTRRG